MYMYINVFKNKYKYLKKENYILFKKLYYS